ncbi:MAG: single-stranded DNA-binding protein [Actinobacteria bacterium]|jgi:single-strand DNA-binding protein|nr:single-stranded DNA-binding protein [Micrococcales bacterium]MCB0904780.1 single-stranded DNA-binding protein [Actinomycetota bacterium]MCO5299972.1 single-stranded DNA-binding protein [Candidatus Nanopelagicales bacterium]MCB9429793.1 single-stranded DNA-binding protein [Actinomycetota bacterium]MCO5301361.1 single-stranded DNA-binding protein [Candidatus Nanopelagicales bacterium]
MVGEPQINMVGNLVADPELRFTPSGVAAASVRIAVTPRSRDNATGEWKDGETVWLSGTVWRQYAENVAESLSKGTRVIVIGRLKQRSYETREGEKRTVYEVDIDDIGPALRYATAKIQKTTRSGTSDGGQSASAASGGGDPWGAPAGGKSGGDSWGGAVDEPPF